MTKITIPGDRRRREQTQIIAGVEFIDGQADVELGPNARSYFERFGFGIEETAVVAGESVPLSEMTRAQLLAEADRLGVPISRRSAKTDEVRAELLAGIDAQQHADDPDDTEPVIEPVALHVDGRNDDDLSAEHLASAETV